MNSKLILMWGWSPADGTFGTGTPQYLKEAKKQGVRIVCVDPRRTRTSRQLADEHIFIKPSTDAAALIAMAYVIVSEGLHDQAYCDRHVLGFDEAHLPAGAPAGASYRAYLMGESDGVPKTPEWAAPITRHSGRDDPPARDRVRAPPSRRRCSAATRPAARPSASSSIARPMRWRRSPATSASSAATRGVSNGATGRGGIKSLPPGTNPIDAQGGDAAAGRSAGARHGGRLSGRHQADLFGRRRSVQPVPQRRQDGGLARRRRVHRRAGPFPDADRAPCRHRAAGDDLLGAQRRAHAVGRRRALRDLHEAGDPADVRVPQRHRHLRRPCRAGRHRRLQRAQRRWSGCAS